MFFQLKLLEKAYFIARKSGPASQFWLLESALRLPCVLSTHWFHYDPTFEITQTLLELISINPTVEKWQ